MAGFTDWTPPAFSPTSIPTLPAVTLSDSEKELVGILQSKQQADRPNMVLTKSYYRAAQAIPNLDIAIDKDLAAKLRTLVGWARVPVDPMVERLAPEGFRLRGETEVNDTLAELWEGSGMDAEFPLAAKDALNAGRGYFLVGSRKGSDLPRMTVESPLNVAVQWATDGQTAKAALQTYTEDLQERAAVYLPDRTIFIGQNERKEWELLDVDNHRFGFVPLVRMANDPDSDNRDGYAEITPSFMSVIDSACRRLMGLEASSELYSLPRLMILGASAEAFQNADGKTRKAWDAYISKINVLEGDEDGNVPTVAQLTAYDPATFTKVVQLYASMAAGESRALPQEFGLYTEGNPISIESLNAMDTSRNRRARLMQRIFGVPLMNAMQLMVRFQNRGQLPREFERFATDWMPPESVTLAQAADPISKLVAAGSLPAQSDVTLKRAGFTAVERAQLEQDRGPQVAQQIVATLQANAKAAQTPAPTSPEVNGGDTAAAGG
jgi:hypothetical protein